MSSRPTAPRPRGGTPSAPSGLKSLRPQDIARFILQSKTMSARDLEELKLDPEVVQKIVGLAASPSPTVRGFRLDIQGPLRPDDLLARDLLMMARDGEKMCRDKFGIRRTKFIAPEHTWTIKTKDGNLVGYAELSEWHMTSNAGSGWNLDLICSFRGGGMELFSEILTYYQERADFVTLEPVDAETGAMYMKAATRLEIPYTKSDPDGVRVITLFGRPARIGDNNLTFWLRNTPWAERLVQNGGWV